MELALTAILWEAKNNHKNIRSKVILSLLDVLIHKIMAYICKKLWIRSDPEFIVDLESYSNIVPEPQTFAELLLALRHHSLHNRLERDLCILYDLSKTPEKSNA